MKVMKYCGFKNCIYVPDILRPKPFLCLELKEFRDESGVLFEGLSE